ncbi:Uncharacterised protein [Enterobacter kobei]|nr:Uncharacterised protein [Enterobacter kobei]
MAGVIFHFVTLFIAFEHHHRRPADNQRKNDLHVRPQAQQAGSDRHENTAENNRPQHTPVEHAVTVLIRHAEPGENRHHHKQVIDGKHLFQRIAGEEQARHLCTVVDIQEHGERHRHHDPEDGPHRRAFQRDRFIVTVHKEVDKHRPNGHHHKDNNGFRRETEMSS